MSPKLYRQRSYSNRAPHKQMEVNWEYPWHFIPRSRT